MINRHQITEGGIIETRAWTALLWSSVVLAFVIMLALTPGFLGYRPIRIWGTSMEPALHDGDALLVKHGDTTEVKIGNIVTIQHASGIQITHHIVR